MKKLSIVLIAAACLLGACKKEDQKEKALEMTIEELELFTEEEAPKVEVVKPKKETPKKEVSLQEIDDEILTIDDFLNDFKI